MISNEADLLRHCASARFTGDGMGAVRRLIGSGIDWEKFAGLAGRHKVMPLAGWSLAACCADLVPPDILGRFRAHQARNTTLNLRLLDELRRLLAELESCGIIAVPFKGLALAAAAYGNLALREAGDLDLLFRRRDIPSACAVLRGLGYEAAGEIRTDLISAARRRLGYRGRISRAHSGDLRHAGEVSGEASKDNHVLIESKYSYHLQFQNPRSGIIVEPHWSVMPRFYSPALDRWMNGVWERLGEQDIFGVRAKAVAPGDLPLLLAVHAGRHLWGQLSWLCDLAEVIRAHPELDWKQSMESAASIGQGRVLRIGLLLAEDVLGAELPGSIAPSVRANRVSAELAAQAKTWLLADDAGEFPGNLGRSRFIMRSMEWRRDRWSWIWHQIAARF